MKNNFKNMKIEINDQQPLDEVVRELEKQGYKEERTYNDGVVCIIASKNGLYSVLNASNPDNPYTHTLSDLKKME